MDHRSGAGNGRRAPLAAGDRFAPVPEATMDLASQDGTPGTLELTRRSCVPRRDRTA